ALPPARASLVYLCAAYSVAGRPVAECCSLPRVADLLAPVVPPTPPPPAPAVPTGSVPARTTRATRAADAASGRCTSIRIRDVNGRISCSAARASGRTDPAIPHPTRTTAAAGAGPASRPHEHAVRVRAECCDRIAVGDVDSPCVAASACPACATESSGSIEACPSHAPATADAASGPCIPACDDRTA